MKLLRLALLGASGRMGQALQEAIARSDALQLVACFGRGGVTHADFDVLVDFSRPEASLAALAVCAAAGRPMVIGTTGFDADAMDRLNDAARAIPLCLSGNFSTGVALCLALVEQAARALGAGFDIEIVEAHHRHKVDAPSGTALMLGQAAARGAGIDFDAHAVMTRHGHTGERPPQAIGFSTIRGGDVVGDHSVLFLGDGERVDISHRASSRSNFALGALRAARWLPAQPPGLYGIRHVLGLG